MFEWLAGWLAGALANVFDIRQSVSQSVSQSVRSSLRLRDCLPFIPASIIHSTFYHSQFISLAADSSAVVLHHHHYFHYYMETHHCLKDAPFFTDLKGLVSTERDVPDG